MNYQKKIVAVTGANGFIGNELVQELHRQGAYVLILEGDVRDAETFESGWIYGDNDEVDTNKRWPVDHHVDYLFHFGSPSSQVLFKRNAAYCIETTMKGIMNAAETCRKHGIRLIYPSTGLLSMTNEPEKKAMRDLVATVKAITNNQYAKGKNLSEDYIRGMGIDALGIRIFATYGPGEGHKADYASVPYLFARDFCESRPAVVYGDGNQVRDFIYIDDTVNAILHLAEECYDETVDVGSGKQVSFNQILDTLAKHFPEKDGFATPDVRRIEAPAGYVKETAANPTRMHDFYHPTVTIEEGLRRMCKSIIEEWKP